MLTQRQAAVLTYLQSYAGQHGYAPSFDEIGAALQIASKSQTHRLLNSLQERGYIRRLPRKWRAIELLRNANGTCPYCGSAVPNERAA